MQGYPQQQGYPAPTPPGASSGNRIMLAIVLVVVLLGAGIGAVVLLSSDDDETSTDDTTTTSSTGAPIIPTPGGGGDDDDPDTTDTTDDDTDTTLSGGGDNDVVTDINGRSPVDVVEAFFDALVEGDCAGAMGHLTENAVTEAGDVTPEEALADCEAAVGPGLDATLDDVQIVDPGASPGDDVVVEFTSTIEGSPATEEWWMILEDDAWKMDEAV